MDPEEHDGLNSSRLLSTELMSPRFSKVPENLSGINFVLTGRWEDS